MKNLNWKSKTLISGGWPKSRELIQKHKLKQLAYQNPPKGFNINWGFWLIGRVFAYSQEIA